MTVLLRLLPLLVVECLLLQQSTAEPSDLEKEEAQDRLTGPFSSCSNEHLEEHLPFNYDDSRAQGDRYKKTLCQNEYVIRYSTKRRTPLFTAQRLNGAALKSARASNSLPTRAQTEYFRPDPRLTSVDHESSTLDAYRGSGYSRGHLTAAGDIIDKTAKMNSYILSNMAPQYGRHNNAWERWENYIRGKAERLESDVLVITGVTKGNTKIRDGNIVVIVPKDWYKLVAWCENNQLQAEHIFAKHEDKYQPETQWWSTITTGLTSINGVTAQLKTVQQVETFIKNKSNIKFEISNSNLCSSIPVVEEVAMLPIVV